MRVAGDPDHPFTRGFLCAKVNRYVERTYHRDRLQFPLRRIGPKGSGQFERISWDEALDEIATRLNEIRASSDGPQAILPYSYAGTMGLIQGSSMDRRFFHRIGASLLDRTICSMAGTVGMRMTVGANIGADPEGIPGERSRAALGNEHAHGESAPVAVRPRGAGARRDDHRDRSDPHAHGRAVRRVDRHPARHRRRARARA